MGPQLYRCGNADLQIVTLALQTASMGPQLYRCGNVGIKDCPPVIEAASMGPQLYRCGNLYPRMSSQVRYGAASMGPQLYRCGNADLQIVTLALQTASMGPQLYRCGNVGIKDCPPVIEAASMGPQLYRCGNLYPRMSSQVRYGAASMGPQLYRCGNPAIPPKPNPASNWLQWGRNFIVAETGHSETDPVIPDVLTEPRDLAVARAGS